MLGWIVIRLGLGCLFHVRWGDCCCSALHIRVRIGILEVSHAVPHSENIPIEFIRSGISGSHLGNAGSNLP